MEVGRAFLFAFEIVAGVGLGAVFVLIVAGCFGYEIVDTDEDEK